MTLIICGCSILCAVAVTLGSARVAEVTTERTRAQMAADAAALAAVATSVPGLTADPRDVASRFARLNGARLIDCWCRPGDTAMQVEVALGRVSARARAVFDPELLRPLRRD